MKSWDCTIRELWDGVTAYAITESFSTNGTATKVCISGMEGASDL